METLKIGIVALMMGLSSFVHAQQGGPAQSQNANKTPEERATMRSTRLTKQLGLTADQERSVYSLCLQHAQQQDANRTKFQEDRNAMRAAQQQNNEVFEQSIDKLLTAEQKTKYEQMKADDKAKMQERRAERKE
jgi:protein CpxP